MLAARPIRFTPASWLAAATTLTAAVLAAAPLAPVPLAAAPLAAQGVRVVYDRVEAWGFDVPDRLPASIAADLPAASARSMVLTVDGRQSLLRPLEVDSGVTSTPGGRSSAESFLGVMRNGSVARSDHETLQSAWTDLAADSMVQVREFLGRTFRVVGPRPPWAWRLSAEQRTFLGHVVQKATAQRDSTVVEAWFTTEIPTPAGPGDFGGLPGLILLVDVDGGRLTWTARAIEADVPETDDLASAPTAEATDGQEIERDAYERLVGEKLEELRASRRRGG